MSTQPSWIDVASSENARSNPFPGHWFNRLRASAGCKVEQLTQLDQRIFMPIIFIVALVLRMTALLALRHVSHLPGMQEGADGIEFEQFARALALGRGFVHPNGVLTSFRAPGFPIFVSLIYRITHLSVSAANLSFPLLGAAGCVVTYLLAKEVVPEGAARLSALLITVYFPAIYFCTVWLSEPLFMFSFALCLWLFLRYLRTRSYAALAAAGLLFSWSVLVRPFVVLMLPALVILDILYSRRRVFTFPLLLVCCLAPTLIWTARNYRVHHAFVLVATNGGSTFYGGNNDTVLKVPQYMGGWVSTVRLPGRAQIEAAPTEYAHDQVEWRLGKQWVRTHLKDMPLLLVMKLIRFVLPDFTSANKKYALLSIVTYLPFLPLWVLGLHAVTNKCNRSVPWLVMHLAIASTIATAMVFWGSPRFRDAAAPMLLVYAGYGLHTWLAPRDSSCAYHGIENIPAT